MAINCCKIPLFLIHTDCFSRLYVIYTPAALVPVIQTKLNFPCASVWNGHWCLFKIAGLRPALHRKCFIYFLPCYIY
jgi:hypothetical protein